MGIPIVTFALELVFGFSAGFLWFMLVFGAAI